jgi:hypothetical protein
MAGATAGRQDAGVTFVRRADRVLIRVLGRLPGEWFADLDEAYAADPAGDRTPVLLREALGYFWLVVWAAVFVPLVAFGRGTALGRNLAVGLGLAVVAAVPAALGAIHAVFEPVVWRRTGPGSHAPRLESDGTFGATAAALALVLWLVFWVLPG